MSDIDPVIQLRSDVAGWSDDKIEKLVDSLGLVRPEAAERWQLIELLSEHPEDCARAVAHLRRHVAAPLTRDERKSLFRVLPDDDSS